MVMLAAVCGLGIGIYFLVDQMRWLGGLLVAHGVLSLAVILANRARQQGAELRSLALI